jgi:AbrB family transcriptional regulator (stage V sporulation protein T)
MEEFFMKATGIVRRIDDLGRVVIPKEIRRTLRIRVGDPLEIYTDSEGEVILKKYSLIGEMGSFAKQYADALSQTTGYQVAVADRERIIAASSGVRKEIMDKPISKELEWMIDQRETRIASGDSKDYRYLWDEREPYAWEVICPIISEGDAVGAVMIFTRNRKEALGEVERKLALAAAGFLGRQLEQ